MAKAANFDSVIVTHKAKFKWSSLATSCLYKFKVSFPYIDM